MYVKKFISKILTFTMMFLLIGGIFIEMVKAAETLPSRFSFSFDESSGAYIDYTHGRRKTNDSYGWVQSDPTNKYSFQAALTACIKLDNQADAYSRFEYHDEIGLLWVTVNPGVNTKLTNWVYESGYSYAAVKGESTTGSAYSALIYWSPDY